MQRRVLAWTVALVALSLSAPARAEEGRMLELARAIAVEHGPTPWATLFEGNVVHQVDPHRIVGVDLETGLTRWEYRAGAVPIRRIHRNGELLVITATDLQLVSLRDGSVVWTFPMGCRPDGECQVRAIHVDDRRAVLKGFGARPDSLMLVDLASREQAWPSWVDIGPFRHVEVGEHLILAGDPTGRHITAVDPAVGRVRWKVELSDGAPPLRMWTSDAGAHVFRAHPGGRGTSEILTLAMADGARGRTVTGVSCSGNLADCGVLPGAGSAVSWDVGRVARGGPGHVVVHDLAAGTTTLDEQAYYTGRPLLVAGRLLILGHVERGQVTVEGRWLPGGKLAWSRRVPGDGRGLQMAFGAGQVYVVDGRSGAVSGLSVRDGTVRTFGVVDLKGERAGAVFPTPLGLLVATERRLAALRDRPLSEIVADLRRALLAGEDARVEELDRLVVRLASQLDEAAAAHGLVLRHALLLATEAVRRGGGGPELARVGDLLARTPAGRLEPVLDFAAGLNNLLSEHVLSRPGEAGDPTSAGLAALSQTWLGRLELLGKALEEADAGARERITATGLQLAEALDRAGRYPAAWNVLRTLDRLPLALDPHTLPTPSRRIVARRAADLAKRAAGEARKGDVGTAVETLGSALALPFAAVIIAREDPSRLQIEIFLTGQEEPRRRELTVIAKEAARDWAQLIPAGAPLRSLECMEACQRRWLTCERPCVPRPACDESNLACVDACERSLQPEWPAPRGTARPGDIDYLAKCL